MKIVISVLFLTILGAAAAFAAPQDVTTLKGKVLDGASNEPAGWATVALMTTDSTVVAGATCDENGAYELKAAAGDYIFAADLIGYKSYKQPVLLKGGVVESAPVLLAVDAQMLSGATVTDRVKLIDVKIDKVVMNVSESAFAQGSDALELIKKAPGVTIDKDGNIKLNGKNVSVWIDGRPSQLDGKSLEALLRSTNGESIDKFEIMEHPSAKYDAAGQGGIINIKTKRNLRQGFNGSAGINGSGMYFSDLKQFPWDESVWANLAYRGKKTNTFLNLYEGIYDSAYSIASETSMAPINFLQSALSQFKYSYKNYNVKFGNDWFIDGKNTLGFIVTLSGADDVMNSLSSTVDQFVSGVKTSQTRSSISNGPEKNLRPSVNLNYTHVFDEKKAQEITVNLDYFNNTKNSAGSQIDTVFAGGATTPSDITLQTIGADNAYNIYSAKADFQSVIFQKYMFEAGAKWALSSTDNNSFEKKVNAVTMAEIFNHPSDFRYREHVAAAYFNVAGQLGPKWSLKAGLRGEYTNSYGDWRTSGTETRRGYFDLFPTVFVGFNPNENWRFATSYTRRINRPGYYALDPIKMYVDAKTYTVGNPDILPAYDNDFNLTAAYGQHLSLTLGYDYSYNVIEQIPTFQTDGTQCLTWGNFGTQSIGYVNFGVSALPVTKWFQWTAYITGMYLRSASLRSNADVTSWSANYYTDLTFILPKDWKISIDSYGTTSVKMGYYTMYPNFAANMAVKKNLLENRMTLSIKLQDIFRTTAMHLDIDDETGLGAFSHMNQDFKQQKLTIGLSWNFGQAQKPMKHRNVGNLEEMSRAGSGGGTGGISGASVK